MKQPFYFTQTSRISIDLLALFFLIGLSDTIPSDAADIKQNNRLFKTYYKFISGEYTFHFHNPGQFPAGFNYIFSKHI